MIYLLEDDDAIRELVLYTLQSQGMEARGFALPSAFWKAMDDQAPDLLVLDLMLPEEDGLSILRALRASARCRRLPVILLTARDSEYDKVVGLDGGADDYVTKPFGMMELLSRIRALLRRTAPQSGALRFGDLEADPDRHRVTAAGAEIALTQKEFELLCLLLRSPGTVFTREQLLSSVWGYEYAGETRTVDAHVRTLRQKLGDAGRYIETVRGYGYRLGEGA
jgi:two-component system, OmpR family, alkaline phosphatase synthesis response regulator PhoP